MSSLNYEMFCKILNNESISRLRIDFVALQEELFNKLLGEFIAPIEREDIFILQKRLEEEFIAICSFSLLKSREKNFFAEDVSCLLKDNISIFSELKNFKNPRKLLKLVKENKNTAIKLLTSEEYNSDKSKVLKVAEKIFYIDIEVERIVLNNN